MDVSGESAGPAGGGDGDRDGGDRDGDPESGDRDGDEVEVRRARADDHDDVAAFTTDTWADRGAGDYVAHVFPEWVESDDDSQRTLVADLDGTVVGLCQATVLSAHEGWMGAMRVHPAHRGEGISTLLNDAGFEWLAERGCVVARNMVFSWNVAGLGGSRAAGFEPCTEFRWAEPAPDHDTGTPASHDADPDAAWAFWGRSAARSHLRGLALDAGESWALSELTRENIRDAADDGRLLTVRDGGVAGFTLRNRTYDREDDDGDEETWAEYAVAAWDSPDACAALLDAVARDAADLGADRTRVLVPESAQWVTDVAFARHPVSEEPDFVLEADLVEWAAGRE